MEVSGHLQLATAEMKHLLFVCVVFCASLLCACTSVQYFRDPGITIVRLTTNAQGEIASVVVIKSAGSAGLDQAAVDYLKKHFHGPPNFSRVFAFVYKPPKA